MKARVPRCEAYYSITIRLCPRRFDHEAGRSVRFEQNRNPETWGTFLLR